jgi:hypothetical protein
MFKAHRFISRILRSPNIRRKEMSGYPNGLNNRVAKAIVPRKKIIDFLDPEISTIDSFFTGIFFSRSKGFKTKIPDKIIRRIPRQRGNIPVPAIRKVPMGIFKESKVVTAPKRKMTIPPKASSLSNRFPPLSLRK